MTALAAIKAAARKAAFARRKTAFETGHPAPAALLGQALEQAMSPMPAGRVVAGYMAMRTEIDPTAAMRAHAARGQVCVPVIIAPGEPLRFARWTPDTIMAEGPFGARIPAVIDWIVPDVLIVPLVAFDRRGGRLGYGGGFYDRTLQDLRRARPVTAIGFAWAGQEDGDLPLEPTDQPLDLIVTETEIIRPAG